MRSPELLTKVTTKFALSLTALFLTSVPCLAQPTSVDSLMRFAGNIHQFNSIFPQEKVYLQFDNTSYYTGETIWFKAFVVSATTLGRPQSKVLYVDLVSPDGSLIQQQKLKIIGGQADGQFTLLDGATAQAREKRGVIEYPSGFYEVRAYTRFMLNFTEEAIFSRVFAIYDKPRKEGGYYTENPTITLRKSETQITRPETEKLRDINCSFYPEGGHLIVGKPCRVAFKVTDETGFGVDATGVMEDTGLSFSTVHDGMGWFTFTPQDRRNQVRITVGKDSKSFTLPKAEQAGCALSVSPYGADSLIFRIDLTSGLAGIPLGMTMSFRGELVKFVTFETGTAPTEKVVEMTGIPEGVIRINIFDKEGNIYASRSVYHHSSFFKAPELEVQSDRQVFAPFDKVELKFSLHDGNGVPFRDRFCLSVRDARGQENAFADDLRTSLLLSSDLKGLIENPAWYFDSDDPERETALDLLMLVQGWERYDWLTMTGQKEFHERHRLEKSLTLNGWVLNSSGNKPMEGIEVLAALMPQDKRLSETYTYTTDSSGYFGFDIGAEFYDKARFTIDAHTTKKHLIGPSARIQFDRSLTPSIRAYKPQELVFNSTQSASKDKGKDEKQSADEDLPMVINKDLGMLLPDVDIEEERMYIDYFTFKALDVVKDVEIDLDKGDYSTDLLGYLLDKGYSVLINDSGGIDMINGFSPFIYVHDTKKYQYQGIFENPAMIDSKDIKSIIIFDSPMYLGNILTQCPLYLEHLNKTGGTLYGDTLTRTRLLLVDVLVKEGRELSTRDEIYNINKRITTVDGYSRPYEFYAPEYPDGPIIGDVDYRRTIYWNPNVITDSIGQAKVEFYNNSITTHFNVSAAGLTSSGIPYTLETGF